MRFDSVKKLKGEAFRRLTGVQRSTFEDMVAFCCQTQAESSRRQAQHALHRRPASDDAGILACGPIFISRKLTGSARARRTATSNGAKTRWRAARPSGCRGKAVAASGHVFDVVLIDATETPIE